MVDSIVERTFCHGNGEHVRWRCLLSLSGIVLVASIIMRDLLKGAPTKAGVNNPPIVVFSMRSCREATRRDMHHRLRRARDIHMEENDRSAIQGSRSKVTVEVGGKDLIAAGLY